MTSKRAWKTYPSTYRQREIKTLARWIQAGESGSIVGLAGAGKSNLLGFLSHQPQVVAQHLLGSAPKLALVFVDLNNLPDMSLATFYRVILRSLYEARKQLAEIERPLPVAIETLYRKVEDKSDPFLSQSALREALLLFREEDIRLVLVLDPFDQFCQTASTQVLDNLRGLRDSFKTMLSYIVGLRRELAYTRDPLELGELYEILDINVCWVGTMEAEDARWVISQVEAGAGETFGEAQVNELIRLTGAYPALLKAASLWLSRNPSDLELKTWEKSLLDEPSIQNRLRELWQGLTGEEQFVLTELRALQKQKSRQKAFQAFYDKQSQVLNSLKQKRLCLLNERQDWQVFSPLLAVYVERQTGGGKIWFRQADDAILKGNRSLEDDLTPQSRKLLLHFLARPGKLLSKDTLIYALWSDEEVLAKGVNDSRLQKAISDLRGILEKGEDEPCYIKTVTRSGYRFFSEGAPKS